jgi:O-acetylhomoserine/O-acetylserine sulfhydrylase
VGTEHIDDIIADFEQSFAHAATKPGQGADNSKVTGDANVSGKTVV